MSQTRIKYCSFVLSLFVSTSLEPSPRCQMVSFTVAVALTAVLMWNCADASKSNFTIFGLVNDAIETTRLSSAFNSWITDQFVASGYRSKSIVATQTIAWYLIKSDAMLPYVPTASASLSATMSKSIGLDRQLRNAPHASTPPKRTNGGSSGGSSSSFPSNLQNLSSVLRAIWTQGSVPLLEVRPSPDPDANRNLFDTVLWNYFLFGGESSFNDFITGPQSVETVGIDVVNETRELMWEVIIPFLFPNVIDGLLLDDLMNDCYNGLVGDSGAPQLCDGVPCHWWHSDVMRNVSVRIISDEVLVQSRRMYLSFAPAFNTMRFPWCIEYQYDVLDMSISNTAESFTRMWNTLVVAEIASMIQYLLTMGCLLASEVQPNHNTSTSNHAPSFQCNASHPLDGRHFLQLMWSSSLTQKSKLWPTDPSVDFWDAWLPNWTCPMQTTASMDRPAICGPDWLGMVCVNVNESDVAPVSEYKPVVETIKNLSRLKGAIWNYPKVLGTEISRSVPLALQAIGAAAFENVDGGVERKDTWVYDILMFAFRDPMIHLVVPLNVRDFVTSLGMPTIAVHLEIYSFDDALCCDGTDVASGAYVMNRVSAATAEAASVKALVSVDAGAGRLMCFECRVMDDQTFMGFNYSLHDACVCTPSPSTNPGDTSSSTLSSILAIVDDPTVLGCTGVVLLVVISVIIFRRRRTIRAVKNMKQRMILGRYIVRRVLQHCKHFSSVLVAFDVVQNTEVILKQYVLLSDNAVALASNEIEKYRACSGYPHLVQLVQSTFAWKQIRRSASSLDSLTASGGRFPISDRRLTSKSSKRSSGAGSTLSTASSRKSVVLNDVNASQIPFAIVVMKKYASGDMRHFIETIKETTAAEGRGDDPYSGVSFHEVVSLLTQICLALRTLHDVIRPGDPLLHRDVKPENIFLERRPLLSIHRQATTTTASPPPPLTRESSMHSTTSSTSSRTSCSKKETREQFVYVAHLGDFGCSVYESQLRPISSSLSPRPATNRDESVNVQQTYLPTRAVGTVRYMAPESRLGQYGTAGDIWSAGCTILYAIMRHPPTDFYESLCRDSFVSELRHLLTRYALIPSWFAELVLQHMLHFDPVRRSSADKILGMVRCAVTGSPVVDAALNLKRNLSDELGEPSPTVTELEQGQQGDPIDSDIDGGKKTTTPRVTAGAASATGAVAVVSPSHHEMSPRSDGLSSEQPLLINGSGEGGSSSSSSGSLESSSSDPNNQQHLLVLDDADIVAISSVWMEPSSAMQSPRET